MPRKYDEDWRKVNMDVALHILKQGQVFIEAEIKLAIAADHRAMITASILTGFAAGLLAAALRYFDDQTTRSLGFTILAMASFMFCGAFCCFWSARPVPFGLPGSMPKQLWPHRRFRNRAVVIGGEAERTAEALSDANERTLKINARWLRLGIIAAGLAPIAGGITWTILTYSNLVHG